MMPEREGRFLESAEGQVRFYAIACNISSGLYMVNNNGRAMPKLV